MAALDHSGVDEEQGGERIVKVQVDYKAIRAAVVASIEEWADGMEVTDITFTRIRESEGGGVYAVANIEARDERSQS